MREYLHEKSVEFDDRNIRQSEQARQELLELTGSLMVPYLTYRNQTVTGFDPDGLDQVATSYRSAALIGS